MQPWLPSVHQVPWEASLEPMFQLNWWVTRWLRKTGGKTLADCYIVEVFCGRAGLSRALRRKGFQVFLSIIRRSRGFLFCWLTWIHQHSAKFLKSFWCKGVCCMCTLHLLAVLHLWQGAYRWRNGKGPKPLRSMRCPMGLPKLPFVSRERVSKANRLYSLTWRYIRMLDKMLVGWSVENPSSSLMWITTPFIELMQCLGKKCLGFCFHNCMFGSRRKKMTAIWTSVEELLQLERICDDTHEHDAWGVTKDGSFATTQECACDPVLCAHWANAIAQHAQRMGYEAPPATLDDVAPEYLQLKDVANRAITGCLPRGNKLPPLLTDFLCTKVVHLERFPFLKHAQPGSRLPDNSHFCPGARLIRFLNGQKGVEIGMPLEPEDYIKRACKLVHPNMRPVKLPEGMETAILLYGCWLCGGSAPCPCSLDEIYDWHVQSVQGSRRATQLGTTWAFEVGLGG